MRHDRYSIQNLPEICYHLSKYRKEAQDWQADFYDMEDNLICSFDSDDETRQRIQDDNSLYEMVTEMMDIAMMMGKEFIL